MYTFKQLILQIFVECNLETFSDGTAFNDDGLCRKIILESAANDVYSMKIQIMLIETSGIFN